MLLAVPHSTAGGLLEVREYLLPQWLYLDLCQLNHWHRTEPIVRLQGSGRDRSSDRGCESVTWGDKELCVPLLGLIHLLFHTVSPSFAPSHAPPQKCFPSSKELTVHGFCCCCKGPALSGISFPTFLLSATAIWLTACLQQLLPVEKCIDVQRALHKTIFQGMRVLVTPLPSNQFGKEKLIGKLDG